VSPAPFHSKEKKMEYIFSNPWECTVFPLLGYLMIAIPTLAALFLIYRYVIPNAKEGLSDYKYSTYKNLEGAGKLKKTIWLIGKPIVGLLAILVLVALILGVIVVITVLIDKYVWAFQSLINWCR
jgi:hypothetical protein